MPDRRVNSKMLLVGSLPAESAEHAFRAGAELFGDMVFSLPDGETGPMGGWVGFERERLIRPSADVVVVAETESPTGLPRHAYETPVFGVRAGVERGPLRHAGRGSTRRSRPTACSRELRDAGVIPAGLRFQIGLPFPPSAMNAFKADFASDYPIAEAGVSRIWSRASCHGCSTRSRRRTSRSSGTRLRDAGHRGRAGLDQRRARGSASPVRSQRLTRLIPEEVLVGYHLCYGTFPEWPMYEARDIGVLVRMANFAVAESGRTVDWLHLAGPRYLRSEDRSFFRPLVDLEPGHGARLPRDRAPARRRARAPPSARDRVALHRRTSAWRCTAASAASPDRTAIETMREHSQVIRSLT